MRVKLEAEEIMEIHAVCPEENRLIVGGNDWGFLKVIQITGGYFTGEKLTGRIIPGGADWNMGVGGNTEDTVHSRTVFAKYLLQTNDGVYIAIENLGYKYIDQDKNTVIQTRPSFHAPKGKYEWLNYGVYVASLCGRTENGIRGVDIKIYKMM